MVKILAALGIVFLSGCASIHEKPPSQSTVKIILSGGHGSGVHIGDGLFLTAAHVVQDFKTVKVKNERNQESDGNVLWASKDYDVALISVDGYKGSKSNLNCKAQKVGDDVIAKGNPVNNEFVTTWGKISGDAITAGPWKSVYRVQVVIAPGSSGGPLFDKYGDVVGLNVGMGMFSTGFGASAYGLSFSVPSTEICKLLAKA